MTSKPQSILATDNANISSLKPKIPSPPQKDYPTKLFETQISKNKSENKNIEIFKTKAIPNLDTKVRDSVQNSVIKNDASKSRNTSESGFFEQIDFLNLFKKPKESSIETKNIMKKCEICTAECKKTLNYCHTCNTKFQKK